MVRLHEHPEFVQAVDRAAEHFRARGLRRAFVEKDYFVTEVLRVIAGTWGRNVIFKGGTSLSKGWNLIDRFSEDIDVFLDPASFTPTLSKKGIDRELKRICTAVGSHPALSYMRLKGKTIGGRNRNDWFSFEQRCGGPQKLEPRILLESGTASGREPTVEVQLNSYLAQFLLETGESMDAEDEAPFVMRLLHFRRTFVEKLFAIHAKVEIFMRDGRPIDAYARHYYDLFQLAGHLEVLEMLASPEYVAIKVDYDEISRRYYARDYLPPTNLNFAASSALFPEGKLAESLRSDYEQQCRQLCFGAFPSWDQVRRRFEAIRHLL